MCVLIDNWFNDIDYADGAGGDDGDDAEDEGESLRYSSLGGDNLGSSLDR